jgi:hypothetical protein
MRKLIAKGLLFVVSLALLDAAFSRLLDRGRPDDYLAFIDSKRDFDSQGQIDVLLLGDSHTADGLVPSVIQQRCGLTAFNFGVYHLSPVEGYFLLKDLMGRLHRPPRIVVLGTNARMFTRRVTEGKYTPLFIRNPFVLGELLTTTGSTNLSVFTSSGKKTELFQPMLKTFMHGPNTQAVRDIAGIDRGYLQNVRSFTNRGDLQANLAFFDLDIVSTQVEYFEKTIEFLEKRDVEVIIVNLPMHREFLQAVRGRKTFREFERTIADIATRHQVELFNESHRVLMGELRDSDYLNGEHLCYPGAIKFTAALAQDLAVRKYALRDRVMR